jgi:large subunit ribosomal protein L13
MKKISEKVEKTQRDKRQSKIRHSKTRPGTAVTKSLSQEAADASRSWWVVDAADVRLGRLVSEVAALIRGKSNPKFTPHTDCGDTVIVLNAAKVKVTGNKGKNKIYYRHTSYIGGLKSVSLAEQLAKNPEDVIVEAVNGMLPKGRLGKGSLRSRIKVIAGQEHPYSAQQPKPYKLKYIG